MSNIFRSPQFTFVLDFLEDDEQALINDIVHNKLNLADHYDPKLTMMKETLAELWDKNVKQMTYKVEFLEKGWVTLKSTRFHYLEVQIKLETTTTSYHF